MPFAKSWKRHETAAAYQARRHHLDNISDQPLAPEVAARWTERVPAERRLSQSTRRDAVPKKEEQEETTTSPFAGSLEHLSHGNNRERRRVCYRCAERQALQSHRGTEGGLDWEVHYLDVIMVRALQHVAGAKGDPKGASSRLLSGRLLHQGPHSIRRERQIDGFLSQRRPKKRDGRLLVPHGEWAGG